MVPTRIALFPRSGRPQVGHTSCLASRMSPTFPLRFPCLTLNSRSPAAFVSFAIIDILQNTSKIYYTLIRYWLRCEISPRYKVPASTRYFTGKPCKHGHVCERFASGGCVECAAIRCRAWVEANRERVKAGFKAWVAKNESHYRETGKRWRRANIDRKRAANAKWAAENKDKVLDSAKRHRSNNIEKYRAKSREDRLKFAERNRAYQEAYRKANPQVKVASEARRRARKRAAAGNFTVADISVIRKMQKDRCGYCAIKLKGKGHVDHIVALVRGGSNDRTNLQILCGKCNTRKHARDPIEFAQSLGLLL